jgi:RHS repeat-associated protein
MVPGKSRNTTNSIARCSSIPASEEPTTNAALCKVVEYSYSPVGGDTGTRQPNRTRRTITRLLGQEVAREYVVLLDGEDRQVQCATPGTAWNAADNLVTVTKFSTDTNSYGVITSVTQPDGTMSLYEYAYDGSSNLVSTVWTGKPGAAGTNIVDGTKTVSVHDPMGLKLSTTTADIASDIVTSQETYSEFDEFGRASRVTYLDGTFTLASHSCCGVESETSREGLTTSYLYDDLKRRIAVVRPGPNGGNLTMFTVYDAAGRTLQTIRQGEDDSQIVQQVTTYNTVGRTTSTTDALTNTTTYAESISGSGELVRTTIYPNGATHIQTQYKDGSSKSTTGTAVHGVRHEYGVETDGLGNTSAYTKIIRLDETGADTSEWAKTYTDMLGRAYLTKYPDGASARQFYNTKGQLWKTLDPDGVTQLHQYNNLGEQEYTALDMDRDDTIDFAGTDQITRTVRSVGQSSSLSGNAHISQTYIWTTNNVDSSLLISRSESLVDGTGSASTSFGLTSFSYHSCGGSCEGTNIAPDGTYTVTIKTNGYATRITRYDSNHAQLGRVLFGYDAHGRSSAVTNLLGSTADSAVPTGDSPAVQITLTSFDLLDRPVTMIRGVGTSLAQTNTHHYDTMGRLWRQIEPDATSVTNEFYLTSATKKTYGSRTYPVEWTYDYAGRQKTMKTWQDFAGNAGTATTTWNYDSQRGWLASKQYADGQGPSYTYTDAGRLETRTWARTVNGQPLVTTYGYDNAGQQNSIDYSDSTPDATYTHDRRGRQVAAASSSGNQTLTYNDASQLVAETWTSGPLNGLTVSNTYDGLLRRSDLSSFNDVTLLTHVTYGFDVASRLLSVSDGTNNATYSYLANSHLMSNIVFQQNTTTRMTTTKSYDNLGRLTSIGSVPSGIGVAPVSFEYQYNLANQRTAVTNADGSYWLYGYDTLGQVISGKRYWSDGVPVAGQQFEYGFDDIGNRKTAKSGGNASGTDLRSSIYQANALNQYVSRTVPPYVDITGSADTNATVTVNLLPATRQGDYFRREVPAPNTMKTAWIGITNVAVRPDGGNADILSDKEGHLFVPRSPETFGYDADGNMRSDGRFRYTWDAENRMVSAETTFSAAAAGAPRQKVDWSYLPDGRWSQRTVSEWNGSAWVPQATNRFVWDGVVLLAVLSGNNQVTQSYMRGTDLSGTMTGAGGVGGVLLTTDHGPLTSDTYANAFDGNGNVTRLVDMASGEAAAEYEYSPFGETLRSTGPMAEVNLLRFSTQFADGATAHYKYLHREYPPHLGRWPNRDPIGEDGGENVYVFTGNDPMRFVDFLGLRWKVDRKGGGKAPAEPEDGDTVADLANLIGLNAADYQKWLSPVGGSAMPTSSSQRLTKCDKFEIPNTVVAYWAGDLGWVGRWWVRWNSSIKYLGKRGFNVDDQRHQRGSTWALQTSLQSKAGAKELHGLYFWGHGTAPYPAQYLASSTGDVLLEFSSANLSYKMALGLVFACDSNAGQSALSSGTSGHIWKGFSGTLVPWPFRHYHARHYISPGQQETH